MAGVATKKKRKRAEKFTPSRASRIEVVEDTPAAEERIAVPLGQDADHSIVVSVPPVNGRLSHGPARRIEPPAAAAEQLGKLVSIPVDEIRPNPFQPRQEWDQAELEELAASIQVHGIRQPLDVRLVDDDYELVAGERRLRAAKLAGLAEVPAILKVTSDKESREIALIENLQRKDLSDIELARAFQRLMEQDGYTAEQLAARLHGPDGAKRTRSYVANLVRLLELPEEWQQRVVSREMPSTHARYLLPYKEAPAILQAVETYIERHGLPSLKVWEHTLTDLVRNAGHALSRNVTTHACDARDGKFQSTDVRIDAKHPRYAELNVVEIPCRWREGKEKIALNAALAKQILAEKAAEWRAKTAKPKSQSTPPNGPTKSQLAAQAKAERERMRRGLAELVDRWRLLRTADLIDVESCTHGEFMQVLLYCWLWGGDAWEEAERALARHCGLKGSCYKPQEKDRLLRAIAPKADLDAVAATLVSAALRYLASDEPYDRPSRQEVLAITLAEDPSSEWSVVAADGVQVMMGPLTQEYLELHTEGQLQSLMDEWGVGFSLEDRQEQLIARIRAPRSQPLAMPAELADLIGAAKRKAK